MSGFHPRDRDDSVVRGSGAYAGLSVEARKDLLGGANEGAGGCPLN